MTALVVLFCLVLPSPALAANRYTMERREKESTLPYTFGDLAAARLAVYGILDARFRTPQPETSESISRLDAVKLLWSAFAGESEPGEASKENTGQNVGKTDIVLYSYSKENVAESDNTLTFSDVPEEYTDCVAWACQNGIAHGLTDREFGVYNASETAFVTMLLNTLGYGGQFEEMYALHFAEDIGLIPVGLSRDATLGNAALYLQRAMDLRTADGMNVREKMKLPAEVQQTTFPATICLTPLYAEDMETQLREATRYLPATVEINTECLKKDDVLAFYHRYRNAESESWYTSRVESAPEVRVDMIMSYQLSDDELKEFDAALESIYQDYKDGKISYEECCARNYLENANYLCSGKGVTVYLRYNEAWELVCDLDDAFTLYVDDSITRRADSFYRQSFFLARTEKEKVYTAKNAINYKADYAAPIGHNEYGDYYAPEAHSILGFFEKSRIVCDGYASVFQYLMLRANMDCVVVLGSTVSREDAESGGCDHAWNKVKVDGEWQNMDVCWSDTGWPYTFDLKSDQFYAGRRHWAVSYRYL